MPPPPPKPPVPPPNPPRPVPFVVRVLDVAGFRLRRTLTPFARPAALPALLLVLAACGEDRPISYGSTDMGDMGDMGAIGFADVAELEERFDTPSREFFARADEFFLTRPDAPFGARRLDPALEGSRTFGYYNQELEDVS